MSYYTETPFRARISTLFQDIADALTDQTGSCEVAVPTRGRLVVVRGPMPVSDVITASVRFLRSAALVAGEDAVDAIAALDAERFERFALEVWDWWSQVVGHEPDDLTKEDLESARQFIGAKRPDELAAELTDPRAVAALQGDSERRAEPVPRRDDPCPWLIEIYAARWLAGKVAEKAAEQYPIDMDTAQAIAQRAGLSHVPNPECFSAAQLAYARSQRFRAALRRARVSLADFESAHREATRRLADIADGVYWDLDAIVEEAREECERRRRESGDAPV